MSKEKTSKRLTHFQNKLLEMKKVLTEKTEKSQIGPADQDDSGDEIDLAQHLVINEMNEKLSLRDKQTLVHITEALARIQDESFGQCEACEEDISEKRLEVLPFCKFCVFCAERTEKLARQYR